MGFPPQGTDGRTGLLEVEQSLVPLTENNAINLNTINETSLGSKDVTVEIPDGATVISVIALAKINIMNNAATAQKIDLRLNVEGTTLFNQTDVVGFGSVDGASAVYVIAENASDEVTDNGQVVTLEALETLLNSASVRFQAQYYLFITYRLS